MRQEDRNAKEKHNIKEMLKNGIPKHALKTLLENIEKSGLNDITEYGRVVHAEMDAILGCARRGISSKDSIMFCTTYPCHNCAKHIIASGISKVIFIEPYPKSKAYDMHDDAIRNAEDDESEKVLFLPFVGVGPRQFVNFFSMSLSVGGTVRRKKKNTFAKEKWERKNARPRVKMFPTSYRENENTVASEAHEVFSHMATIKIK